MREQESNVEDALILIVDDDPLAQFQLEYMLRAKDYTNIIVVDCGSAALKLVETIEPDCILLDVLMPGISGFETCRLLRCDKRFTRTPIIIQTSLIDTKDRRQAFEAGASDIVSKPFDHTEIEARVRVHLSNSLINRHLATYHSRLDSELQEARILIETTLPQAANLVDAAKFGVSLSYANLPYSVIGGDYWNSWVLGDNQIAIIFADVSGHGVSAALRMFALNSLLSPPPPFSGDPVQMAAYLDQRLYDYGQALGQFVAGIYGIIDLSAGVFRYVGAGLRDGLILSCNGNVKSIKMSGLPFGLEEEVHRVQREVQLGQGDTLVLYSDALVECANSINAPSNVSDLCNWVAPLLSEAPIYGFAPWLADRFLAEFGDGVRDDLLIVSIRIER